MMFHAEGQYDFKNVIKFMDLQVGSSTRQYILQSNGTIFDDKNAPIIIQEYGAYAQAGKWIADRRIRLSASGRYDKNLNFKGRFNPRLSALFKLNENTNIRLSYQTGFRIPSTQGQYIDLSILTARLLGGLPQFYEKYDLGRKSSTGQNLAFEGFSVEKYAKAVFDNGSTPAAIMDPKNTALLKPFEWTPVRPERVQNFEIGFKSLINNELMIDAAYYYNIYHDFITQVRVRIADELSDGTPNYGTILNGTALTKEFDGSISGNTAQIYTNFTDRVTSQGAVLGLTYSMPRGYSLGGNYNWNVLQHAPPPDQFMSEFNTPKNKVNIMFGNRKLTDKLGFNVTWRWQQQFFWQSSFTIPANGFVPSYNTLDAQVSYRISAAKSVVKIGGSNLLNKTYIQSLGGPGIGAIYYVSVTFDQLSR
jgi:iron complex outermembrane receptor protein